ncbi:MAG: LysM peptidoglycan-binding domain-containing protein [Chloroflexi bacterium]|nr:LysM peptidoglycan-binding domain-containing protein [Chloroflexota bacterium]
MTISLSQEQVAQRPWGGTAYENVIALERAKRRRPRRAARLDRREPAGRILSWPNTASTIRSDELTHPAERPATRTSHASSRSSARRRRRPSALRRWAPTALVVALLLGIVALGLALRWSTSHLMATEIAQAPPVEIHPVAPPAAEAPNVASEPASVGPAEPAVAEPSTSEGLRFTTKPVVPTYKVALGDTLSSIAVRQNVSVEALQAINKLENSVISVNQALIIP